MLSPTAGFVPSVVFMVDKQRFVGTTADEFGSFIRAHAVGEGQNNLKKSKRKTVIIMISVGLVSLAVSFGIEFLGPMINNRIPKTFTYGDYSIRLTSAFDGYGGEWNSSDATVYCFSETKHSDETAADYLLNTNKSYEIDCDVTAVSDTCVWTTFTNTMKKEIIIIMTM